MRNMKLFFVVALCWYTNIAAQQLQEYSVETTSNAVRSENYLSIRDSVGREWYISENKIDCWEAGNWSHFNVSGLGFVYEMKLSADTSLWINCLYSVFRISKNKTITQYDTTTFQTGHSLSLWVQNDQIAIAPEYGGPTTENNRNIFFFNGSGWTEKNFGTGIVIHQEKNGTIWYQTPTSIIKATLSDHTIFSIPESALFKFSIRSSTDDVWFHNGQAILKYNGTGVEYFSEIDNKTIAVQNGTLVENDGIIWANVNNKKLGKYTNGEWSIVNTLHDPNTGIIASDNKIFFLEELKLWTLENNTETEIILPNSPSTTSVTFDYTTNSVFYNDNNDRLYKWQTGNWKPQETLQPGALPLGGGGKSISFFDGVLTVSYWDGQGIFSYNGKWNQYPNKGSDGLLSDQIYKVAEDPASNIWVATRRSISILVNDEEWHNLPYPASFNVQTHYVNDLKTDNSANIWLASNAGLLRYNGSAWTTYGYSVLQANEVFEIEIDKNQNVWILTENGIGMFNRSNSTYTAYNVITVNNPRRSKILLSTPDCIMTALDFSITPPLLFKFNNNTWTSTVLTPTAPISSETTRASELIRNGNGIWIKRGLNNSTSELFKVETNSLIPQPSLGTGYTELCSDNYNKLWSINFLDKSLVSYNNNIALPTASNQADLFVDHSDNIWIGGFKLYKLTREEIVNGTTDSDAIENIITVFPVPAENNITVEGEFDHASIRIINELGIEILNMNYYKGEQIDISTLAPGIYYLQIFNDNKFNTHCFSKK